MPAPREVEAGQHTPKFGAVQIVPCEHKIGALKCFIHSACLTYISLLRVLYRDAMVRQANVIASLSHMSN